MDALTIIDAILYFLLAGHVAVRARRTQQPALGRLAVFLAAIGTVAASVPALSLESNWFAIVTLLGGIALYPVLLLRFGSHLTGTGQWLERLAIAVLVTELLVMATAPVVLDFRGAILLDLLVAGALALLAHGAVLVVLRQQVQRLPSSFVRRRALALTAGLVLLAASLGVGIFAGLFADLPAEVPLVGGALAAMLLSAAAAPPRWLQAAFILPDWDRLLQAEEAITRDHDPAAGLEHAVGELALLLCAERAWLTRDDTLVTFVGRRPDADDLAVASGEGIVSRPWLGPDGEPQWMLAATYLGHRLTVVADRDPVLYGLDATQLLPRTVRRLSVAHEGHEAAARRRAQELAEREAEHYRQVAELKDDLLSTINHELRTPLGLVTGALELLDGRWDELDDDQRRLLTERASANATDLAAVVEQVLALVELRSGDVRLRANRTTAGDLVHQALAGLPTAGRVTVTAPQVDVLVDAGLLGRMVRELVDNALRHTADVVEVAVTVGDDELLVDVVDRGPGLHDDLADTFARGGHYLHRTTRGLGLGLTLVVETAAALGGEVVFEDTQDGTRVSCRVPHGAAVRTGRVPSAPTITPRDTA